MDHQLRVRIACELRVDLLWSDARVHVALAHPDVHLPSRDALQVGAEKYIWTEQDLAVFRNRANDRLGIARRDADVRLRFDLGSGVHVADNDSPWMLGFPGT